MTSPTPDSPSQDYRPINRRYLRTLIASLNDDDTGGGTFAQIAERLIHRRKCPNIVPATEPSSGGDYGQDSRSQDVILDEWGIFRLFSSPPTTKERWIFAFSIRVDWKGKLKSDAKRIIEKGLEPERIVFVTNQFINPEHVKIDAEREVEQEFGVSCEILDGQWILQQLYSDDYQVAVDFLDCPPQEDPELLRMFQRVYGLKESGMSEEEGLEVERLKRDVQYRNLYTGIPEHLVQDIERIADILSRYESHIDESLQWYREAISLLEQIRIIPVAIDLLYSYFKALFKLPDGTKQIYPLLPQFIDLIFKSAAPSQYIYAHVWLTYLYPKYHQDTEFTRLYDETQKRFQAIDRDQMSRLNEAYLDEVLLFLELRPDENYKVNLDRYLARLHEFLGDVRDVQEFPFEAIAQTISTLAPMWKDSSVYEDLFSLALELLSSQKGNFQKANLFRDRALAHERAGQLREAIIAATSAKNIWFNADTMRGFLLVTYTLSIWYARLGYFQAAEYELYQGIHIILWQPPFLEADILAAMVAQLGSIALQQGLPLLSYRWLELYPKVCQLYRVEPNKEVEEAIDRNLIKLLANLYATNRQIHDRLLELGSLVVPDRIAEYKTIVISSDDDFKTYLDVDLTEEMREGFSEMRREILSGDVPQLDLSIVDESGESLVTGWFVSVPYQEHLEIRIIRRNVQNLNLAAFAIASLLQEWFLFLGPETDRLTITDDRVDIELVIDEKASEPIQIMPQFTDDIVKLTVSIRPSLIDDMTNADSRPFMKFFGLIALTLIHAVTIDPTDTLDEFAAPEKQNKTFEKIVRTAPPSYLWKNAPLVREILGEPNAN